MENALKSMNLEFLGTGQHKISAEKFFETKDVLFLDVRDSNEVKTLRFNFEIFGIKTMNIPINELSNRLNELPKDKLIACFCSAGTRSSWAYIYLFSKAYKVKLFDINNEELAAMLKPGRILKAVK